ncbi:MAG: alkaline phosphatase [Flavobacteriales bacterium]|mgnify:FL=1|nr:alkaline phosphatase [Flavobacteriales bacterium]|tara:strand:- start:13057 stop:14673 length:1617 start_codon:yes stop_codon:yes gene_type:complete
MKRIFIFVFVLNAFLLTAQDSTVSKIHPKLLVGIVVDQMRYDYLFRYWDKLGEGGFKKMIKEGYLFKNANYSYVPTYTAPGHASIYAGCTPSQHGVVANEWYDESFKVTRYCVADKRFNSVGTATEEGEMSPKNMLVTTIGDELKLSNNNHSKVISIALKDRSSILPGGHKADAAYWINKQGKWITSSYYMKTLPSWVESMNTSRPGKFYLGSRWEPIFPLMEYEESYSDNNDYEETHLWEDSPVFPHDYSSVTEEIGYSFVKYTPMGNTMTKDFAQKAVVKEKLGQDKYTDLLAVSFSPIDYIGHFYGPHSVEMEDAIIQLDGDLASFFNFIEKYVGNEVLYFLTADHGAVNVPRYLSDQKVPSGYFDSKACVNLINSQFKTTYGVDSIVENYSNSQLKIARNMIQKYRLNPEYIQEKIIQIIKGFSGVKEVLVIKDLKDGAYSNMAKKVVNGYFEGRSGDLYVVLKPGWIHDRVKGTTHGSGYSYDTHVPLIFMGAGVKNGSSNQMVNIKDIAPTISTLINVSFPNGTTGKPLRFE